jgi:hypothetical protein
MSFRSIAAFLLVSSILSAQARAEEVHENWMKFLTGKWSWKSTDGNHGTVVFEPFSNVRAQTVKERCENLDTSTLMTQGWRPDTKTFGGTGFDSMGNYVETFFTKMTESKMTGHRIRRSADKEVKELWEATRKGDNEYEIVITIDGKPITVAVTRQ